MLVKNKIRLFSGVGLASAIGYVMSAFAASAAVPSASSTLDTIMETVVNTTVSLVTVVFTTYWPYVLIVGIISGLVGLFVKFAHLGTGRGK
jgi:hypothetical protein